MPLFQKNVLKDYLKKQDQEKVASAYTIFSDYFHNSEVQQNIRNSKEEEFQALFLSRLFVDVLGYTIKPDTGFNLTTEFKNEKGAQKADGAILQGEKVLAVIELKSTKTKDLERIRKQAFDYKANHSFLKELQKAKVKLNLEEEVEWMDYFNKQKAKVQELQREVDCRLSAILNPGYWAIKFTTYSDRGLNISPYTCNQKPGITA